MNIARSFFFWFSFSLIIGDMVGWQMNAKPLIDTTAKRSLRVRVGKSKNDELMLSVLKGIDTISVIVEITSAPIATGLSIRTYFKSLRQLKLAKITSKISLNIFSSKSKWPILSDSYRRGRRIHRRRHQLRVRRILMIPKIKLQMR